MKGLFKIIRRYIVSAVLLIMFVVLINLCIFFYVGVRYTSFDPAPASYLSTTNLLDSLSQALTPAETNGDTSRSTSASSVQLYTISQHGMDLLNESGYVWGMLLDPGGNILWSWNLPENLDHPYTLQDVAQFSRWYLDDYPVHIWESKDNLLVMARDKEQFFRLNLTFETTLTDAISNYLFLFTILNLLLIFVLALWFGYRFYRSLCPLAEGIDALAGNHPVMLSEKGITGELSKKINKTSNLLAKQNEKLRQRDNARTDWISGVSHDIRTPLSLITGYSETLSCDPSLSVKNRALADRIRRQSLVIRQLISDLNLTSKLEYNSQPLQLSDCFPAVLLRGTAAEYYNEGLDQRYSIEVRISPQAERVQLRGDVNLLKRALRNILGNSIRHNPEGCQITAELSVQNGLAVFRFSDSGPGIPPAVADALDTGKLPADLHIMGLRIVDQIIRAHGGKLYFPKIKKEALGVEFRLPTLPSEAQTSPRIS